MITFYGGPGERRQTMLLRRAPIFLRVVVDETTGEVDALDQPDDTPGPSERVHVYRRRGSVDSVHLCSRGKSKHLSGFYAIAEYDYLPDVEGENVRMTEAWRAWCHGQPEARPKAEAFES